MLLWIKMLTGKCPGLLPGNTSLARINSNTLWRVVLLLTSYPQIASQDRGKTVFVIRWLMRNHLRVLNLRVNSQVSALTPLAAEPAA